MKPASRKVLDAAEALGLKIEIVSMADSTRTAEDAAAACGCSVGQIVKSLVFANRETGAPVMLLVSGANRVDVDAVCGRTGLALGRADANAVRAATGFAIGGIPPFGHATPLATFMDRDLMSHAVIWAAAGTPNSVFSCTPAELARAASATVIEMT